MDCLNCRAVNRDDRRFCRSCGTALSIVCTGCGFTNEADDTFCGGCGQSVSAGAAPAPEAPPAQARDLPAQLPQGAFLGDRRQLTVMFCDLVGSTSISEQVDPEEMARLLTEYRDACSEVVERFGGFIGNFMGDGLLIYFGYPLANEDDPQRAIRASLSIIAAVEALNNERSAPVAWLTVRIGINTGLVVTADIGSGEQREKMAIVGDTPNIAARLQSLAEPGTVLIGNKTHRLVEGLFVCDPLGPRELKGFSVPMDVYRVLQSTDARSRFEVTLQRGLTPIAGRTEEIGLLVSRWQQAKAKEGQLVLISGEPGVGKSRVVEALQSFVAEDGGPMVNLVCSSYRKDTPFYPVIDFLERALGAQISSKPEKVLDNLDVFLSDLGLGTDSNASLIASMLSLPTAGRYQTVSMTLEDQKKSILKTLVTIAKALSAQAPLLIVVEDLQWADHSTREFLDLLVDEVRTRPVLLVSAFRADFEPPWSRDPNVTILRLRRLSRPESIDLIDGVTRGRALPAEVRDHILDKTDGIPLFIEELTKLVLEMDLLELRDDKYVLTGPLRATAIPDSLQDSLTARLDHLAASKEVAQLASVVGRTFGHTLLLAVSQMSEKVLDVALTRLVVAELLYRRGLAPDVVYEFKHALVRDAAYQGLLRSKRLQLHEEIAGIVEDKFPQMAERSPELLAYHYREAGDVEKAIPYFFKAGDEAAGRYASAEASAHYQSARDMAKAMGDPEKSARCQIKAILKLANVAFTRDQLENNLGNLDQANELAEKIGHRVRLCQIRYWIGRTYYVMGRFKLATDYARMALDIADTLGGDDRIKTGPVNLLARVHCLLGEPVDAISYATRSVKQMHEAGDSLEEAAVSGVLAFAHAQHGEHAEALAAANHGVELAEQVGHLPTTAACFMFRGVVNGWFGKLADADLDFEQGLYVCEKSGDVFRKYLTLGWQGEARLIAGDIQAARNSLEQCLTLGNGLGTVFHRGAFEAFLAKAMLEQGDVDAALTTSEAAVATATQSSETWPLSIALRIEAEIQLGLAKPDLKRAQQSIETAIKIQQKRQCGCDLAWSHLIQGHVLAAEGELEAADALYAKTVLRFNGFGIERGAKLAEEARASLGLHK
ncbi:adenylate/guanylate cyclase domain-containing protein [Sulfitobacter sp. SK012]|uniref:adenylate/guanylate cyclase domain-containing protein n=1 Tax=Sulfitobacter sp. SK012 TaxID=1389005 RepID=UPI000E0C51D8|nr:adenylate/guanylate cyclase domain-containing protein [Sulfitobacter sp. SK012]AXI46734.1 adenylate/guanylate cyclase domain-containing protein [Sulfitobacter sp. SK012]